MRSRTSTERKTMVAGASRSARGFDLLFGCVLGYAQRGLSASLKQTGSFRDGCLPTSQDQANQMME